MFGLCVVIGGLAFIVFLTFFAKRYRVYRANRCVQKYLLKSYCIIVWFHIIWYPSVIEFEQVSKISRVVAICYVCLHIQYRSIIDKLCENIIVSNTLGLSINEELVDASKITGCLATQHLFPGVIVWYSFLFEVACANLKLSPGWQAYM